MKKLRHAYLVLTAAFMPYLASCSSDPNPFDKTIVSEDNTVKICLKLKVDATRADNDSEYNSDMSSDAEKSLSVAYIYVFDAQKGFEAPAHTIDVLDTDAVELEVSPGVKTIYVVSARPISELGATVTAGNLIEDFNKSVLNSTLADLSVSSSDDPVSVKELVLVGKSDSQQVLVSAAKDEIPQSNVFKIKMVRLLSKTQVKYVSGDTDSKFGFTIGDPSFRVCQTNNKMRLEHDPANEVHDFSNATESNVFSVGYSSCSDLDFKLAVSDFTAEGCHYISENIVKNPVAGNTTFVSICVPMTPVKYFTYDSDSKLTLTDESGVKDQDFYSVGVVDRKYGLEDFAMDSTTGYVVAFKSETEANAYRNALNSRDTSAITVSESETPLRAPIARASEVNHKEFNTVKFDKGRAYYRVNICTGAEMKVERNKFYKITVNSISNLGFHDESLLRPGDPTSDPGNSTSAWIEAQLSVQPWGEEKQTVDL